MYCAAMTAVVGFFDLKEVPGLPNNIGAIEPVTDHFADHAQ